MSKTNNKPNLAMGKAGVATNKVAGVNSNENSQETQETKGEGVKFAFDFTACMNVEIIGEEARKCLLDISKCKNPETFGLRADYTAHQRAVVLRYAKRFKAAEVLLDCFDKLSEFALNKAKTEEGKKDTQERLKIYKDLLSELVAIDLQDKCDKIATLVTLNENLMGKANERAGGLKAKNESLQAANESLQAENESLQAELARYKAMAEANAAKSLKKA